MALAIYGLFPALYQNSVSLNLILNGQHETFLFLHDTSCEH